jgi:hypothetical protein
VSQERPISVELQIDGTSPLSGRLRTDDGDWRGFAGWIGLAGAIDGVLEGHGREDERDHDGTSRPYTGDL